jgi:RNA polymerase sigma-70 factor (ECF subfamily)
MVTNNSLGRTPPDYSDLDVPPRGPETAESNCALSRFVREIETYRPYLLLIANRELSPELRQIVGASDLVQESLIEAQQSLGNFAGKSEEQFLAWLRRILVNNVTDAARCYRQAMTRTLSLQGQPVSEIGQVVDPQPTPAAALLAADRVEQLQVAIGRLPDEDRRVIQLRNFELLSFAEIAGRMGKTAGTVCRTWYRAIERLRRELEDSSSGGP